MFARGVRALRFPIGFLALAVTAAPAPGAAQTAASEVAPGGRVQDVDLSVETLYDSNVAAYGIGNGGRRGFRHSDIIFEPAIHVDLARPIGRETVYIQGSAGYDFYTRNTILNRENINLTGGALAPIGICQTTVAGAYSRAQSDLSELALTPSGAPTVVQTRNAYQVEEVSGSADCGRATGLTSNAQVSETWTQNSSPVQRYTNARTFSGAAGLGYRRPILGTISLFGAYSQTNYPDRAALALLLGVPVSTGYQTYSGGVRYNRAIGSRLQANGSISYTKLNSEGGLSRGFSGLTYSAGLTYQISPRLGAQALISRATVPSIRLNSTFGLDNIYSGQLSYTMTSRLTLSGGGSIAHDTYNGIPYPVGFDITDEKIYRVFGNAEYKLTRRISLGLNAEHLQRDANFPGLSYPETRVGLTARAKF